MTKIGRDSNLARPLLLQSVERENGSNRNGSSARVATRKPIPIATSLKVGRTLEAAP